MAWAQMLSVMSLPSISNPILDLNHWRSSSTREISAIGTSQISAARRVMSSNPSSGDVSRMLYPRSNARRISSCLIKDAFIDNTHETACRKHFLQPHRSEDRTHMACHPTLRQRWVKISTLWYTSSRIPDLSRRGHPPPWANGCPPKNGGHCIYPTTLKSGP